MTPVLYVDATYGSDSHSGDLLHPLLTLDYAYSVVPSGGIVVFQEGTYTLSSSIAKNLHLRAAYGSNVTLGSTLDVVDAQTLVEGINFSHPDVAIAINNSSLGGIYIKNCVFESSFYPINIQKSNYVNVHRSRFGNFTEGLVVHECRELNVSGNIFFNGGRAVTVQDIGRLDLWQNTIFDSYDISGGSGSGNLRVLYITLSSLNISSKTVSLPTEAVDVAMNVVNGPSFGEGEDYVFDYDQTISWDGYRLENEFKTGDIVRVMYVEADDPVKGDSVRAINVTDPNSRIDSNNITDAGVGVYFTSPIKVRHNNFNDTTVHWVGTPTDSEGNITGDPLYNDPTASAWDFRISPSSPDLNKADPTRWDNILDEITTSSREGVAPFDRNLDATGAHRNYVDATGDIGAHEVFSGDPPAINFYVDEQGFDIINYGNLSDPFATIDKGFDVAAIGDIKIGINDVVGSFSDGWKYGRYRSKDINLSPAFTSVGRETTRDIAFVYPSYPSYSTGELYVDPEGSDVTGDGSSIKPYQTIQAAIDDGSQDNIMVYPGVYPSFTGKLGKKLIGVPKTTVISLTAKSYKKVEAAYWTVLSGSPVFSIRSIEMVDPSDIVSDFGLQGRIEFKFKINTQSKDFNIRLEDTTTNDLVSIVREEPSSVARLVLRHKTGGVSYSLGQVFSDDGSDVRCHILIEGNHVTMFAKGPTTNLSREFDLASVASTDVWKIGLTSSGSVSTLVSAFSIEASEVTGTITPDTSTKMGRKVFGILGSR